MSRYTIYEIYTPSRLYYRYPRCGYCECIPTISYSSHYHICLPSTSSTYCSQRWMGGRCPSFPPPLLRTATLAKAMASAATASSPATSPPASPASAPTAPASAPAAPASAPTTSASWPPWRSRGPRAKALINKEPNYYKLIGNICALFFYYTFKVN